MFPWNMGFSCNFSLKPINWIFRLLGLFWLWGSGDQHSNQTKYVSWSQPHFNALTCTLWHSCDHWSCWASNIDENPIPSAKTTFSIWNRLELHCFPIGTWSKNLGGFHIFLSFSFPISTSAAVGCLPVARRHRQAVHSFGRFEMQLEQNGL